MTTLVRREPYLAYANFAPIAQREGALLEVHRRHRRTAAAKLGALVARDEGGKPLAMIALEAREFESQHFGLRMARIDPVVAVEEEESRLAALRAIYTAAGQSLRESGFEHVTIAASTDDRVAGWVLQEAGAFYTGTKISWLQTLTGQPYEHRLTPGLHIETYERPTAETLPQRRWRRLLDWSKVSFDRGPLVFDLNLPFGQSTDLYRVWTEKALTGEWAEALLLVCEGDEIVAFHSMMRLPELSEAAGVGILGRGIGGTLPGYRGLFTALQRETAAMRPLGAGYLENETQSSNVQSIHVFGKLGHQCIRSTASYHRRLDGRGDRRVQVG